MARILPLHRARPERDLELSDDVLVVACAEGDASALGALFDRHGEAVHGYLMRMMAGDRERADDILQETFIGAFESAKRFKRQSAVRTWLIAIATRIASKRFRSGSRRSERERAYASMHLVSPACPEAEASQREAARTVLEALADLTHEQRAAFLLTHVEGISGIEAARILGLHQSTFYRRQAEARGKVRLALDEHDDEGTLR